MDLYRRQQFEFLLQTAVERWAERLEQRHRGANAALQSLTSGQCQSDLEDFVQAVFSDFLLDNADGAGFILQAIPQRRLGYPLTLSPQQSMEAILIQLAKQQFSALLYSKTLEALEQHAGYQPVEVGATH